MMQSPIKLPQRASLRRPFTVTTSRAYRRRIRNGADPAQLPCSSDDLWDLGAAIFG
jgi:hypothetical protein